MKERLDALLQREGFADSRSRARAIIMSGKVFVNGQREDKAGAMFDPAGLRLEVRGAALPYVSRGGLKLEKALRVFSLSLEGLVCMDIGASTGGFTDCMLQNGAAFVYAIDVGQGQLAWSLRTDKRVACMEKTNFRYLTPEDIPVPPDFACADVSFISLSKILLPARRILKDGGGMVCLIKPQFEAGRAQVGKKGVVREPGVWREVIRRVCILADILGFILRGLDYSPIKGPEGNVEFLLYLEKDVSRNDEAEALTQAGVEELAEEKLRTGQSLALFRITTGAAAGLTAAAAEERIRQVVEEAASGKEGT